MGKYDTNVGPILLGIFRMSSFNLPYHWTDLIFMKVNTYLYGLVANQYMNYVNHKFNDPAWIRAIVIILFVLDTTHSAVGIYAAWDLCVTNFNNPNILGTVNWTVSFTAVATATSGVVTQTFLIHRVFKLTKNKWLVVFLATLSIGGYVCGWITAVKSGIIKEVGKFRQILPLAIGWLALLCIVDLLITAILIFVLVHSKTGFHHTDTIINRLIRGAIQTGLFVSMFALGDLFSSIFALHTSIHLMFAYPIGRIYTNTLLDTLNARMVFYRMDQQSSFGGMGVRLIPRRQTCPFHMQTYIHPTCLDILPDMLHNECIAGAPQTVESLRVDDKSNG
ncbi:hypothetical protein DFH08DRAFT_1040555 [Mycena albidolilacea]|uniref:DUF6534 domain-containing protein n=1 Tax=Mycena albidolilacea TaxID=1033008 RepID=A0AAD6ZBN7_9AGAR|nr:hypothetical protein DFH08DRAFT_1040555 [Mycena albidolilacea]